MCVLVGVKETLIKFVGFIEGFRHGYAFHALNEDVEIWPYIPHSYTPRLIGGSACKSLVNGDSKLLQRVDSSTLFNTNPIKRWAALYLKTNQKMHKRKSLKKVIKMHKNKSLKKVIKYAQYNLKSSFPTTMSAITKLFTHINLSTSNYCKIQCENKKMWRPKF